VIESVKIRRIGILVLVGLSIGISNFIRKLLRRNFTLWERNNWSIGIYCGTSPFSLTPIQKVTNPVLTANGVTDIKAKFVADPFMVKEDSTWYMFFEAFNSDTKKGDIGLATSNDGFNWNYERIVLSEPWSLSYPYVFKFENYYYMIPGTGKSTKLYKAIDFPINWKFVKTLLDGNHADSSIFKSGDLWFLFSETHKLHYDTLRLYFAKKLTGPWNEHPKSPIILGDPSRARPAGRVILVNNKIIRFAQDAKISYGNSIRAFEIIKISQTEYEEKELENNPILSASGFGWNKKGMHQIDAHEVDENSWIAATDGLAASRFFVIDN